MKNLSIRILSIILILIFSASILCSCASKSFDTAAPESMNGAKDNMAGSGLMSPEASNGTQTSIETERKIIKTVTISAETKKFDETVQNINQMVADIGGYVENSSVTGNSINSSTRSRNANFTLRVPADKLDEFTGNVENSVNVTKLSSDSTEITESYYDAVARLEVLESQRASLQKMLDEAKSINEMLSIQDRLYDVIEEIESYQARINSYDKKVEYSTVTINIHEVLEYTPVDTPKNFGGRFITAFKRGWVNFWAGCQDFAVWFAGAIPSIILICGISVGVFFLAKKVVKSAKAKKIARKSKKNETKNEIAE